MKKKRNSTEQIVAALKQAEMGLAVAERERLARADEERWAHFLQLADDRDRCIRLRAFTEELRARLLEAGHEVDSPAALQWIEWAEARIAAMDPASFPFERVFRQK